jgi:hypothetical protein
VLAHQVSVRIPHSLFVRWASLSLHPALISGCGPFLAVVWLVCREIDSVVISASVCPPGVWVVEAIVDLLLVDDVSEGHL